MFAALWIVIVVVGLAALAVLLPYVHIRFIEPDWDYKRWPWRH